MGTLQIHRLAAGKLTACAFSALALLAIAAMLTPALQAQNAQVGPENESGQPARAVRLSYVDGTVQLSEGDQAVAEQAVINTPLLQGITISTANDGKAEIQFEDGSVARIAPNSALTLSTLIGTGASSEADLTLERGEAYFELQGNGQVGPMHVRFGDSVIDASGFTVLRVQFDTPPGSVAVFSGNAHLQRGNNTFLDLHGGDSLAFNDSSGGYSLTGSIPSDSWDAWNSDRDEELNAQMATQTNAPTDLAQGGASNPAWSDLDASGSWYNVPGQGYVWSPYEASNDGFDPYGYGSWVWMPGFGYTWASGYSWGYLPYSCGAWNFYDSFGWGWAPGFGGCSPWWSTGFYGGPVIGYSPGWYRPVHRPEPPRERWPRHPVPVIRVNRHEPGVGNPLPPRDRSTPVTIGGATVVGLRPLPGRATPRPGIVVRGLTPPLQNGGGNRPGFTAPRNTYEPPTLRGNTPQPGRQGGNEPQPGGFTPAPQPGRIYGPPANRGNVAPNAPANPAPSPRPYTPPTGAAPAPRPYTPPTGAAPAPRSYSPPPSAAPAPRPYTPPAGAAPAPRPYSPPPSAAPAPRPYTPPSRPSNPGGGSFHSSPAPNPGGGGGFHGGGNPGGGNMGGNRGGSPGGGHR